MIREKNLKIPEFSAGMNVTYWNGKEFFSTKITGIRLNPISNIVEYAINYRSGSTSKGKFKAWSTPFNIKQSKHFKGDNHV